MQKQLLSEAERQKLYNALRGNVLNNEAILTSQKDTSFAGVSQDVPDEEVISAIRSVPCHYAESYFPIRILEVDSGKVYVVDRPQDIPSGVSIKVLELNVRG